MPTDPPDLKIDLSAVRGLTSTFCAILTRDARFDGYKSGLASGLERGRREAQTEIDGLTYAKGQDDERARIEAIVSRRLSAPPGALENARCELDDVLAAIRSGEPAPEAK